MRSGVCGVGCEGWECDRYVGYVRINAGGWGVTSLTWLHWKRRREIARWR